MDKMKTTTPNFSDRSWSKRSPELCDFVQKLLKKRPEARGTSSEMLQHPWALNMKSITSNKDEKETNNLVSKWSETDLEELKEKLKDVQSRNEDLEKQLNEGRRLEEEMIAEIEKRICDVSE